jgi:hypothetical protein
MNVGDNVGYDRQMDNQSVTRWLFVIAPLKLGRRLLWSILKLPRRLWMFIRFIRFYVWARICLKAIPRDAAKYAWQLCTIQPSDRLP